MCSGDCLPVTRTFRFRLIRARIVRSRNGCGAPFLAAQRSNQDARAAENPEGQPVLLRLRECPGADDADRPRPILDHDLGAQNLLENRLQKPRLHVVPAAQRVGYNPSEPLPTDVRTPRSGCDRPESLPSSGGGGRPPVRLETLADSATAWPARHVYSWVAAHGPGCHPAVAWPAPARRVETACLGRCALAPRA